MGSAKNGAKAKNGMGRGLQKAFPQQDEGKDQTSSNMLMRETVQ